MQSRSNIYQNHSNIYLKPLLAMAVAVGVSGLAACGHRHKEAHDGEAEEHHHESDEIVMRPSDARRFGVEVEAIVPAPFSEVVKVSGEVMPSVADRAVVSAPTH